MTKSLFVCLFVMKCPYKIVTKTSIKEQIFLFLSGKVLLSDLRIVLLGFKNAGKSSTGNSILGQQEFDLGCISQCVKRQGVVEGRKITLVETPPASYFNLEQTPQFLQNEIILSVSQSPPGPHAFLFLLRSDVNFDKQYGQAVQKYLEQLGEHVWKHTLIVFTCGDSLGDTTIENYIESEGHDLKWLIQKCNMRYHVINNKIRGDRKQILKLLQKIDGMIATNKGHHFQLDSTILKRESDRKKAETQKVEHRKMLAVKQSRIFRYVMGKLNRLTIIF